MAKKSVNTAIEEVLVSNSDFEYAHLVKFERPFAPDSETDKFRTNANRYAYYTDGPRDISFDDGFLCRNGQHPRMLRLLIQRKVSFQTAVVLNHFLGFTKNWDKEITEKIVWPEISLKVARVKPFINFNATECKLIMKEVFVNG